MERTFSPMIRQYSAIDGLQQAYTLVYAMEVEGTQGCRLTLCQIGSRQQIVSQHVAAAPEFCYRLLRYLCENGVQPELWRGCGHRPDSCRAGRRERRRMA